MTAAKPTRSRHPGAWAILLAAFAMVLAVIPVIGDWIGMAVAAGAIALGIVGIRAHERDRTRPLWSALVGAGLGIAALTLASVGLVATVRMD